jgi:hypothetical protein
MYPVPATPIRIVPICSAFLQRARAGIDDLGQPVERHLAAGGEPLRDALRRAVPGEAILLASHCPFTLAGPYREYGPVFVSADAGGMPAMDALPPTSMPCSRTPASPSCWRASRPMAATR